jgi:ankyrin repeat protein
MIQNKDGDTPLHLASREDKVEVARMLLEHGADVMAQNFEDGTLHYIWRHERTKLKSLACFSSTARM